MRQLTKFETLANGSLKISLTDLGRDEVNEKIQDTGAKIFDGHVVAEFCDNLFLELCEYPLCNGWELIAPEDIGALTDSLIFSQDVERDDWGKILKVGDVYWFPDYMIRSPALELARHGFVIFAKAS